MSGCQSVEPNPKRADLDFILNNHSFQLKYMAVISLKVHGCDFPGRFHEQMEAEEKELAKIGIDIKPWTLNDEDKNIVEPNPLGKTLFRVRT